MSSFKERLKELRNQKKLTQKQIAELLNITERGYREYEIGNSTPNFERFVFLIDLFDVSADYLLARSNDPVKH